ncbi:class I SAM-dependent methyltransferase [Acidianus sp. HS-5]|uniref:class I SAM-dependent methyltransferase n=1 Tax=Acidianus sp. HS-5 TaxID=2886040 RepID=UPI001F24A1A6|nr:class I SAM-dependent methyltransferase [Acidianus sp. HS-5]BDC17526.1 type 11 methyltransferase [Acidianus sp. HS-5]
MFEASKYDSWFLKNQNVLESEALLLKYMLEPNPGKALSVGCGSGLFEFILKTRYGITINECVEPSPAMAEVAKSRGLNVKIGQAENLPFEDSSFDTVILNGVLDYANDDAKAVKEAYRILKAGGHIIVADVIAEGSYGLLYKIAELLGSWEDNYIARVRPQNPYNIEYVKQAKWHTVEEIRKLLEDAGFVVVKIAQTLTRHPKYSNESVEYPTDGYDRGDYVAFKGWKPY